MFSSLKGESGEKQSERDKKRDGKEMMNLVWVTARNMKTKTITITADLSMTHSYMVIYDKITYLFTQRHTHRNLSNLLIIVNETAYDF